MNPYWGSDLITFFYVLLVRLHALFTGKLTLQDLASDEVQLIVLIGVGVSTSLLGTLLVLRRMTMLANSLSHTILLGLAIAYVALLPFSPSLQFGMGIDLKVLIGASFASALLTAFCTEGLKRLFKVQEDASISLVFTALFALGIVLVTLFARHSHLEVEAVMGNVDALHVDDILPVFWIALFNVGVLLLFFKEWKITTFDSGLAHHLGFSPLFFSTLLLVQTSLTLMGAFRSVGVLLVLAFLVIPPLTARLFTHRFALLFWLSPLVATLTALLGVALSRHLLSVHHEPLSTAGIVVCLQAAVFVLALFVKKGVVARKVNNDGVLRGG